MVGIPMPRYDSSRRTATSTALRADLAGCHQGCTFCAEPLMNGLKFRYRPVDEVIAKWKTAARAGFPSTMPTSSGRRSGPRRLCAPQGAASSGRPASPRNSPGRPHAGACGPERLHHAEYRLRIDLALHAQERAQACQSAETFAALVEKLHSYGIIVFGLFMFGSTATIRRCSRKPRASTVKATTMPAPIRC